MNIQLYNQQHFKITEKLSQYSRQELLQLQERNLQMLSQQSVIDTLPDKGSKLRETNEIIARLLQFSTDLDDDITVDNTSRFDCPLVKKLDNMTVLTPHQGARKRSVDLANQQAFRHYASSRLLSKPKSKGHHQPYPSIFQTQRPSIVDQSKVKMISFDESFSLQKEQKSSVQECDRQFDMNNPSKSLLNTLNISMDVIQDVNEIEFPVYEEDDDIETMTIDS